MENVYLFEIDSVNPLHWWCQMWPYGYSLHIAYGALAHT